MEETPLGLGRSDDLGPYSSELARRRAESAKARNGFKQKVEWMDFFLVAWIFILVGSWLLILLTLIGIVFDKSLFVAH